MISLLAAAIGVVIAFLKFRNEISSNREQRERDLRWRQADAGKKLNDEMLTDPEAWAAMQMLDYSGREFELPSKEKAVITDADWLRILNPATDVKGEKDVFIRDCFDSLFYYMATLEHYIGSGLIRSDDVAYPLSYYVPLMSTHRTIIDAYLERYRLNGARNFLGRFSDWQQPTISTQSDESASLKSRSTTAE